MAFSSFSSFSSVTVKGSSKNSDIMLPYYALAFRAYNSTNFILSSKTFKDQSPNKVDATFTNNISETISNPTSNSVNGATKSFKVVKGNKADRCILIPSGTTAMLGISNYTFIIVSRRTDPTNTENGSMFGADSTAGFIVGYWDTGTAGVFWNGTVWASGWNTYITPKTNFWIGVLQPTRFRRNGTNVLLSDNDKNKPFNISSTYQFSLSPGAQGGLSFEVCEILFFNTTLDDTQVKDIEKRLSAKYGITIVTA